jgi:hypothetical protein
MIHANGDYYEGEWAEGRKQGKGIYYKSDGSICDGEWRNDKLNGQASEHHPDGSRYCGEYSEGRKHGKGKLVWANRASF